MLQKTLQQQVGFLKRALPSSDCHPDVNNPEPMLNPALIFSAMTQSLWEPGLEFAVPEEAPLP